jgi:hypothetical protein
VKTLEFKIYPSTAQAQTIDLWLEQLKWVWNRGLEIRLEAQQRRWREKSDRKASTCPLACTGVSRNGYRGLGAIASSNSSPSKTRLR